MAPEWWLPASSLPQTSTWMVEVEPQVYSRARMSRQAQHRGPVQRSRRPYEYNQLINNKLQPSAILPSILVKGAPIPTSQARFCRLAVEILIIGGEKTAMLPNWCVMPIANGPIYLGVLLNQSLAGNWICGIFKRLRALVFTKQREREWKEAGTLEHFILFFSSGRIKTRKGAPVCAVHMFLCSPISSGATSSEPRRIKLLPRTHQKDEPERRRKRGPSYIQNNIWLVLFFRHWVVLLLSSKWVERCQQTSGKETNKEVLMKAVYKNNEFQVYTGTFFLNQGWYNLPSFYFYFLKKVRLGRLELRRAQTGLSPASLRCTCKEAGQGEGGGGSMYVSNCCDSLMSVLSLSYSLNIGSERKCRSCQVSTRKKRQQTGGRRKTIWITNVVPVWTSYGMKIYPLSILFSPARDNYYATGDGMVTRETVGFSEKSPPLLDRVGDSLRSSLPTRLKNHPLSLLYVNTLSLASFPMLQMCAHSFTTGLSAGALTAIITARRFDVTVVTDFLNAAKCHLRKRPPAFSRQKWNRKWLPQIMEWNQEARLSTFNK